MKLMTSSIALIAILALTATSAFADRRNGNTSGVSISGWSNSGGEASGGAEVRGNGQTGTISGAGSVSMQSTNVRVGADGQARGRASAAQATGAFSGGMATGTRHSSAAAGSMAAGDSNAGVTTTRTGRGGRN